MARGIKKGTLPTAATAASRIPGIFSLVKMVIFQPAMLVYQRLAKALNTQKSNELIPRMAIFKAGVTFCQAYHFGAIQPLVFRECILPIPSIPTGRPFATFTLRAAGRLAKPTTCRGASLVRDPYHGWYIYLHLPQQINQMWVNIPYMGAMRAFTIIAMKEIDCWVVVLDTLSFDPYLGKIPILTNIFELG